MASPIPRPRPTYVRALPDNTKQTQYKKKERKKVETSATSSTEPVLPSVLTNLLRASAKTEQHKLYERMGYCVVDETTSRCCGQTSIATVKAVWCVQRDDDGKRNTARFHFPRLPCDRRIKRRVTNLVGVETTTTTKRASSKGVSEDASISFVRLFVLYSRDTTSRCDRKQQHLYMLVTKSLVS